MGKGELGAAVSGGIVGAVASYLVSHLLIEITYNTYFSIVFAILFVAVSVILAHRAHSMSTDSSTTSSHHRFQTWLYLFSFLVLISGISCLLVDRQWFYALPYLVKLPLYCILSVALIFLLTFAFVDFLNFYYDVIGPPPTIPPPPQHPIHNNAQVIVLVVADLFIGLLYGFFFGLADLGDSGSGEAAVRLIQRRHYCMPLTILTATVAGVMIKHRASNFEDEMEKDFEETSGSDRRRGSEGRFFREEPNTYANRHTRHDGIIGKLTTMVFGKKTSYRKPETTRI